eukprot:CAMPEP_0181203470 /NCGR_PEP_ID=MMETSP1096-20121128/19404_1 /TAXON_ID=156174 ORGANISM="Chrysochromulina ericina, Strain CCMP281" /NCGR_SAMPLE_ID=MMETSP1096 /ASSEMBLY_ACC=CAM_ASM_000453 /LENGTH=152 /DNA_ID=CAMNT_0023294075 /DNA_START=382 /DNA_END=837 /DNA_ORIENTATION=-
MAGRPALPTQHTQASQSCKHPTCLHFTIIGPRPKRLEVPITARALWVCTCWRDGLYPGPGERPKVLACVMSTGTLPWKQAAESIKALLVRGSTPKEEATTRGLVLSPAFCSTGVYAPGPGVSALSDGGALMVFGPYRRTLSSARVKAARRGS